jgi:8-oxo-dGTP diphosphatase
MSEAALVAAAGAVVLRRRHGRSEVLLVHRPKYDDWSFPKGKLDPEEPSRTAAVREVLEETGVHIRLGPPLQAQAYLFGPRKDRTKLVHYWVGRAREEADVSSYRPNDEVDDVRWIDAESAPKKLTYAHDRETLAEALPFARRTQTLVVLRHAAARDRKGWEGDDRERTLTKYGARQADRLPPTLEAYGVQRLLSSSSRRCWTTVEPYAVAAGLEIAVTDALSEEDATPAKVAHEIRSLLQVKEPAVLCSHRRVLPRIFDVLGVEQPGLDVAAMLVVHHREGRIAALERISAPDGS